MAVNQAGIMGLGVAADIVSAGAAIDGAGNIGLEAVTHAVAARGVAIEGAVFLRLVCAANAVTTDGTVHGATVGILSVGAQGISAGRETVDRAFEHAFTRVACAVAASRGAIAQTDLGGFHKAAEAVAAAAAVHEAELRGLTALALAVTASGEAVGGAGSAGRSHLVMTADTVPARAAVHRAPLGRFPIFAVAVAAGGGAKGTGVEFASEAIVLHIALVGGAGDVGYVADCGRTGGFGYICAVRALALGTDFAWRAESGLAGEIRGAGKMNIGGLGDLHVARPRGSAGVAFGVRSSCGTGDDQGYRRDECLAHATLQYESSLIMPHTETREQVHFSVGAIGAVPIPWPPAPPIPWPRPHVNPKRSDGL